uniref:Uncharacterized protein n=1 Tax=Trichogramma kaykai TaxID=54128 RepID=A0ABD2XJJ8_9HYME
MIAEAAALVSAEKRTTPLAGIMDYLAQHHHRIIPVGFPRTLSTYTAAAAFGHRHRRERVNRVYHKTAFGWDEEKNPSELEI